MHEENHISREIYSLIRLYGVVEKTGRTHRSSLEGIQGVHRDIPYINPLTAVAPSELLTYALDT